MGSDLLEPISETYPSGTNLRYDLLYDKIRDARRQDEEIAEGVWVRERKVADYQAVLRLTTDALTSKTKDLQIAAWLTEAELRVNGMQGLERGLRLMQGLLETFWDSVYPALDDEEDDPAEWRAAPLEWIGSRLGQTVREVPLTRGRQYNLLSYQESRVVGSKRDVTDWQSFEQAQREGKVTADDFDQAVSETPAEFYSKLVDGAAASLDALDELQKTCEAKFSTESLPSFWPLREAVDELRRVATTYVRQKSEFGSYAVAAEAEEDAAAEPPTATAGRGGTATVLAPAVSAPAVPQTRTDALQRVIAAAAFLRQSEPGSPMPFLLLRAVRWGELRAAGKPLDLSLLSPPVTTLRQRLRELAANNKWLELLEAAETAMAEECGRGWLDIQRHVVRACSHLGHHYEPVADAVKKELQILLTDFPELLTATLADDTPTANPETHGWLREAGLAGATAPPEPSVKLSDAEPQEEQEAFRRAFDEAASGRPQNGITVLNKEIARQRVGRRRFQVKAQLAEYCRSAGYRAMAKSILLELSSQIERYHLEEWEPAEEIARVLAMLYDSMSGTEGDAQLKESLYGRICRLDPSQAPPQ